MENGINTSNYSRQQLAKESSVVTGSQKLRPTNTMSELKTHHGGHNTCPNGNKDLIHKRLSP